ALARLGDGPRLELEVPRRGEVRGVALEEVAPIGAGGPGEQRQAHQRERNRVANATHSCFLLGGGFSRDPEAAGSAAASPDRRPRGGPWLDTWGTRCRWCRNGGRGGTRPVLGPSAGSRSRIAAGRASDRRLRG